VNFFSLYLFILDIFVFILKIYIHSRLISSHCCINSVEAAIPVTGNGGDQMNLCICQLLLLFFGLPEN